MAEGEQTKVVGYKSRKDTCAAYALATMLFSTRALNLRLSPKVLNPRRSLLKADRSTTRRALVISLMLSRVRASQVL